jgi:uncharacterized membrane protein
MLAAALTIAASLWVLVIVATPFVAAWAAGTARGSMPWAVLFVYHLGSLICHQRPERSFHLAGLQMPVCARCFGLYAAGAAGLLIAWAVRGTWARTHVRPLLAVSAIPIALSVSLEWAGVVTTTNPFRATTALPLGLAAGVVAVAALRVRGLEDAGPRTEIET